MADKEKPKKTCEIRCLICKKRWDSDKVENPPYWGVVISFCHLCYVKMLEDFERQFPKKYLPVSKKIRIEERKDEEPPWDTDDSEAH